MHKFQVIFYLLLAIIPFTAIAQTEEEKKEMNGLIERLQKGEASKKLVVEQLVSLKKEKEGVEEKYYNNFLKMKALEAEKPTWDSVTHYTDENGNIVDKKFHPKPASVVHWESQIKAALKEHGTITGDLEKVEEKIQSGQEEEIAADEEIKQVKRLIKLRENYFKAIKIVFPDNCGTLPPPESNALAVKAYWDCVFNGTPVNQEKLDEDNLKRGTNFFNSDAVVVPEYSKKDREEKERKIEEMIRTSTAPVKKPIIIPPPSPDNPKPEPTATERLEKALKSFLPKQTAQPATATPVKG